MTQSSLARAPWRQLTSRRIYTNKWISTYHTSKSIMNETAHLYLGDELEPAVHPPDETEFIERRAFPFSEVLEMVRRAEITDSMTVIAVLHAALRLREDGPGGSL